MRFAYEQSVLPGALGSSVPLGLELPTERTYFFDAETGDARTSAARIAL